MARFMLFPSKEVFRNMEIKEHMDHAYARRFAGKVARYLKDRYKVRKVMMFGSLVSGFFNPDFSPINIGFEGIRNDLEADASADCRFHFGHRDPDGLNRLQVVSLQELSPEARAWILSDAEEI
jgi:predicted nucleotidyltransferase